jgi:hypothetical protein
MTQLVRRILLLTLGTGVLSACADRSPEPEDAEAEAAVSTTVPAPNEAAERVTIVTGGGPVIQVLPGPAQFADSARPIIERMPAEMRPMMTMMGENGPFSDKVAVVSGTVRATYWDRGAGGDSVAGTAEFRSQDGARWRVVLKGAAPEDPNPMEPHFGGVATDMTYHGSSGLHAPFVPTVRSAVSFWGMADVYRNGELVAGDAPVHTMLTSDTRGDDFAYKCWDCTREPIEQFHLMLMPADMKKPYAVPGGVLHVMWEKSTSSSGA